MKLVYVLTHAKQGWGTGKRDNYTLSDPVTSEVAAAISITKHSDNNRDSCLKLGARPHDFLVDAVRSFGLFMALGRYLSKHGTPDDTGARVALQQDEFGRYELTPDYDAYTVVGVDDDSSQPVVAHIEAASVLDAKYQFATKYSAEIIAVFLGKHDNVGAQV